jgi:hypothetical protein
VGHLALQGLVATGPLPIVDAEEAFHFPVLKFKNKYSFDGEDAG